MTQTTNIIPALLEIVRGELGLDLTSFTPQGSDALDFREVSIVSLGLALEQAFIAGRLAESTRLAEVEATLAERNARIDALTALVKSEERTSTYYRTRLEEAKRLDASSAVVLRDLLAERHSLRTDPDDVDLSGLDLEAMYKRLIQLVSRDVDAIWELEREFSVSVSLTVTVAGRVRAASQEEAERLAQEAAGDLSFKLQGDLDEGTVTDVDVEHVDVDVL